MSLRPPPAPFCSRPLHFAALVDQIANEKGDDDRDEGDGADGDGEFQVDTPEFRVLNSECRMTGAYAAHPFGVCFCILNSEF